VTTRTNFSKARLSRTEQDALRPLRERYRQTHGLLSTVELERLRFVRWLLETGRISA
jgi:hypothetical protein